jgi:hypothetical protein
MFPRLPGIALVLGSLVYMATVEPYFDLALLIPIIFGLCIIIWPKVTWKVIGAVTVIGLAWLVIEHFRTTPSYNSNSRR